MINYNSEKTNKTQIKSAIARRLHAERISKNLSLEALADAIGYSKPTVAMWEKGWKDGTGMNRIPTSDQLIDIAAFYHCEIGYLLCEYDTKTRQTTDVCKYTGLMPDAVEELYKLSHTYFSNEDGQPAKKRMANSMWMSFISYLLVNIDYILELLFNRDVIWNAEQILKDHPDSQLIKKTFEEYRDNNYKDFEIFKDGIFSDNRKQKEFASIVTHKLQEAHPSITLDDLRLRTEHLDLVYEALKGSKMKQSDYVLSETFLDLIKYYYENKDDFDYNYDDFAVKQELTE